MSDNTKIEWADSTINAVNGCSVTSPGCTNCYAMRLSGTRLQHHPSRIGLTRPSKAGPVWTGDVRLNETQLLQPLRWRRPRKIFWNAHGDLFHENVPDEWIDRVFAVCALTPQHTHMILTKRPERMREYFAALNGRGDPFAEACDEIADALGMAVHPAVLEPSDFPLHNVWLGTSVEDQTRADERIPHLLDTPAAVRFLSMEPLLGLVALSPEWLVDLAWVIIGAESGPGARPMQNTWAEDIVRQCRDADVAVFVKQLSSGTRANHDIETFPDSLQFREFPA